MIAKNRWGDILIRVLVVDDHEVIRIGLKGTLKDIKDILVVGEAKTGEEAVKIIPLLHPNVVLMDVQMPGMGGIEATRKIVKQYENSKILALSAHDEEPFLSNILAAGALGYVTKGASLDEMIEAIHQVAAGQRYFGKDIASRVASNLLDKKTSPFALLSPRERQMAEMVVNGQTNQDIADTMSVAPTTLSTYRTRIYEKLDVENDVQLTHLALRFGVFKKD